MIPKKIHYVWAGGGEKRPEVLKCMESWKKYLPDWEIKEWNDDNFDIDSVPFVKEAIAHKKFAFAADYIRLYALYTEGGLYLDTDVEVVKPFDDLLDKGAFFSFENEIWMGAGTIGSEKGHPLLKILLDYYNGRHFVKKNGKLDTTTNVQIIGSLMQLFYGFKNDGSYQELKDGVVVFPHDYFSPKNYVTEQIEKTPNSYSIHHYNGSWLNPSNRHLDKLVKGIRKVLGKKLFAKAKLNFLKLTNKKFYKKIKNEYFNQKKYAPK